MSGTTTASKDPQSIPGNTDPVDASKLHLLVYSFLLQNNHGRTAQAFARTSGLATSGHLASDTTPAYLSTPFTSNVATDTLPAAANGCGKSGSNKKDAQGIEGNGRKDSAVDGDVKQAASSAGELVDHHIEYLRIRQSICSSIEEGEPKVALDLLSTYFRSVLIPPPSEHLPTTTTTLPSRAEFNATLLRFRLDTQYYVELISSHQELEALKFGQRTLWRYPDIFDTWISHQPLQIHHNVDSTSAVVSREEIKNKRVEIMQHITNVAALVAYPDPRKSTLAYLLVQQRRDELAKAVNLAILQCMGFPNEPSLVSLVRQLATTSAYLVGYRSSSSSSSSAAARIGSDHIGSSNNAVAASSGSRSTEGSRQQPWVLDTFINSESNIDSFV